MRAYRLFNAPKNALLSLLLISSGKMNPNPSGESLSSSKSIAQHNISVEWLLERIFGELIKDKSTRVGREEQEAIDSIESFFQEQFVVQLRLWFHSTLLSSDVNRIIWTICRYLRHKDSQPRRHFLNSEYSWSGSVDLMDVELNYQRGWRYWTNNDHSVTAGRSPGREGTRQPQWSEDLQAHNNQQQLELNLQ